MAKRSEMALLARAILKASDIRENSWIETHRRYRINISDAAKKSTSNKHRAALVGILLQVAWTDSINWAKEVENHHA